MTKHTLSQRSESNLTGVHPDLVKVVRRALENCETDFTVVEGLRTLARQKELVAKGFSKTMKSRHLKGEAVDLYPYYQGAARAEAPTKDKAAKAEHEKRLNQIIDAMLTAADDLGVKITSGGKSWGWDFYHFQIEL
jgi:peptidoglycan L-alanyl-D-glutamate endopeptidase CwlK